MKLAILTSCFLFAFCSPALARQEDEIRCTENVAEEVYECEVPESYMNSAPDEREENESAIEPAELEEEESEPEPILSSHSTSNHASIDSRHTIRPSTWRHKKLMTVLLNKKEMIISHSTFRALETGKIYSQVNTRPKKKILSRRQRRIRNGRIKP